MTHPLQPFRDSKHLHIPSVSRLTASQLHQNHQCHHRLCCFPLLLWSAASGELWRIKMSIMEFQIESLHQRVQTVCGEILRESVDPTQRLFDILHDQPVLLRFVLQSELPKLVVLHRANSLACWHCPSCGRACSDLAAQTLHARCFFASFQHGVVN